MIDSVTDESAAAGADLKRGRRRNPTVAEATKLDRLPPHSPEAEQGVLGCVLLSPNDCMGECIETFKRGAEEFYDLRHQTIYTALAEMYDQRAAIDLVTLQQRLKDKQILEEVGGIAYLATLPDAVLAVPLLIADEPLTALQALAGHVRRQWGRRRTRGG